MRQEAAHAADFGEGGRGRGLGWSHSGGSDEGLRAWVCLWANWVEKAVQAV